MLLEGRTSLVTGAAGALGREVCELLATHGATVYCVDLASGSPEGVAASIRAAGSAAHALCADLTERDAVVAIFDEVRRREGQLDILVNAAIWIRYEALPAINEASVDRMLAVGLKATTWTIQAVIPLMSGCGGSIVNFSSTAADRPAANQFVYSAIKGGINSLTAQAAIELGPLGIRVNAVAPGMIVHAGNAERLGQALIDERRDRTPLGRLGTPADIAGVVLFLVSDLSLFVSGETITVDGGRRHGP
jgi:NAD(P)-dependent dehydrogenase (short-subunit alcohol dehydrogenase family)